jgi:hypothetical protein
MTRRDAGGALLKRSLRRRPTGILATAIGTIGSRPEH